MPSDKSRTTAKKLPAAMRGNGSKAPVYNGKNARRRAEKLFTDIEHLAAQVSADYDKKPRKQGKRAKKPVTVLAPLAPQLPAEDVETQHELQMLRTRVLELESRLKDNGKSASAPILYEKEQMCYAFKESVLEPLQFSKYEEGSEAKNTIRAPLTATGKPIGAMYIESTPERPWESEDKNLLNTVAQQVSQQIQSLRLLASAERARAEAEEATRRFMHESWASYLDAIHQNERIGYAYDQAAVVPYLDALPSEDSVRESVKVMEEQVGILSLKPDPDRPLTENDRKLVAAVANQVAQQVENIRLLADASRARAEAEEATRRMTHESWQNFTTHREEDTLGFAYDTVQVTPLGDTSLPENIALTVPLKVRGEAIGQLAIAGEDRLSPEALELAMAIAAQTSTHLETLRLTEELQQRAEELQELDRLKSGFLANMSHELRTPLNSILGFADVMLMELDGPLTPNMNDDLKLIQKNGQHLLHLINDVLDMAKIESGRMNLNPEKFKLHDMLEEVNSITSTLASERNIALFIEEDSDREVEIYADNTRIRQVMINLVNNAIKFTEKGKIAIRASKQDSSTLLISVKDTGIGIPADKLEDIFLEFTQVDTSTTRKVGGTGLGLPISRRLIEMHGGRLWAESTGIPGEGSTFFVELPVEARITDIIEKREK
jgi:signal transduction histidine kinase